jgi:hypothetical protein
MANLTEAIVGDWLDRYIQAWHTYDETQISEVVGREAIVESWQQETDPPGTWEAEYSPWLVEGDRAIATGWTRYADGQRYWNMFQLVFRDGKCSSFIEWYMTPREEI